VPPSREHSDQAQARAYLPGPAAALAEVRHRQAHELVTARFELHAVEQFARAAHVLGVIRCLVMQLVALPYKAVA